MIRRATIHSEMISVILGESAGHLSFLLKHWLVDMLLIESIIYLFPRDECLTLKVKVDIFEVDRLLLFTFCIQTYLPLLQEFLPVHLLACLDKRVEGSLFISCHRLSPLVLKQLLRRLRLRHLIDATLIQGILLGKFKPLRRLVICERLR